MGVFQELKRRNVFRVGVAYAIGAWLTVQIADIVLDNTGAPDWVIQAIFLILVIGFLTTLIFAWAYEVTPEGIKRERDVIRDDSITHLTAKKLDYVTVAAALGVAAMFIWQQTSDEPRSATSTSRMSSVTTAAVDSQSIAVLPFANRSNLDDDLFFTDGIHDDLLTQLAKIDDLKVISRTSVMEYRDTTKKIPEIAGELGVATVLEGGVQRAGQRIRINAQLIDVSTDEHLWAETFDREMTIDNLFEIQSEITRHIVSAVKGELSEHDKDALADAPTQSVPAYEAYLKARQIMTDSGYNMEKYQAAQPFAELAVTLDPDFAQAQLLLAEVHAYARWIGYDNSPERQTRALAALNRAAAILGENAPEVLAARGFYLYRIELDYAGALDYQIKAAQAMPGDVDLLVETAMSQRRVGLFDEATANLLRAAELDPGSADVATSLVGWLELSHDFDTLRAVLPAARKRFPYDTDIATVHAMLPLYADGDIETARKRLDGVRPNSGLEYVQAVIELPWFERDFAAAIAAFDRPEVRSMTSTSGWRGWREVSQAMAMFELGDADRARELLVPIAAFEIDPAINLISQSSELDAKAYALVLLGEPQNAIAVAKKAMDLTSYESDKLEGTYPIVNMMYVLARSGKRDEAIALLPQVLNQPAGPNSWWLTLDPRWDFMRDDERFNELTRPANFDASVHANKVEAKKVESFVN